jgi:hypothetical protein
MGLLAAAKTRGAVGRLVGSLGAWAFRKMRPSATKGVSGLVELFRRSTAITPNR